MCRFVINWIEISSKHIESQSRPSQVDPVPAGGECCLAADAARAELGAGRELGGVGVVVHAEAAVPDLVQGGRLRGAPGDHPAQVQKAQKQMQ